MKNNKNITIRKRTNKDRSTGRRGSRKRYSLWKAEDNQKWMKCNKETLYWCCAKWNLDIETFVVHDDPARDVWSNAMHRLTEYLKANNWFENTEKGNKRKQIERLTELERLRSEQRVL